MSQANQTHEPAVEVAEDKKNEGQPEGGPAGEAATGSPNRVSLDTPAKDATESAKVDKPLPNQEPAKTTNSHSKSDRQSSEEEHVATRFYDFTPAKIFEIAFHGMPTLKSQFEPTWTLAELSGAVIIDHHTFDTLRDALIEIERMSNYKIPFVFQKTQILMNIVSTLVEDQSLDSQITDQWAGAVAEAINAKDSTNHSSARAEATPIHQANGLLQTTVTPKALNADFGKSDVSTDKTVRDFRDDFRHKSTMVPPSHTSSKQGPLIAELGDGTKIYGAPDRSDRAPQILTYPDLEDITQPAWNAFIVKFRRVDLKARPENKIPMSSCVDPGIISELCKETKLDFDKWHHYSNEEISIAMFKLVGPTTGSQAKNDLKAVCFRFDDRHTGQEEFTAKLKKFLREKTDMLADITISADEWKNPNELTKTMIIEAINHCFTNEGTYTRFNVTKPVNSNLPKIREIIRDNKASTVPEIFAIIREHFDQIDQNVRSKQGTYHVFPFMNKPIKAEKRGRAFEQRGDGRPSKWSHSEKTDKQPRHERGVCGSRAHECSEGTCLVWGEPEAKPVGYNWSPGEPSVWLPNARFQELCNL
jgi:hypothetical protein